ncbi:MAG: hypothetical protein AABX59_01280 [Nanoarchaeota archaeon]
MLPHTHFLVGIVFALLAWKSNFLSLAVALLIPLLAVAIDLDHFVIMLLKLKTINLRVWNRAVNRQISLWSFIHYWPAFFVITSASILLYFVSPQYSYIIAASYVPHFLLDKLYKKLARGRERNIKQIFGINYYIYEFEIVFDLLLLVAIFLLI